MGKTDQGAGRALVNVELALGCHCAFGRCKVLGPPWNVEAADQARPEFVRIIMQARVLCRPGCYLGARVELVVVRERHFRNRAEARGFCAIAAGSLLVELVVLGVDSS